MYEARQQAYIELVQMLLDAGIGNENEIFEAHSELVDAGLIVVLRERARSLRQENDHDSALTAEWLIIISDQLFWQLGLKIGGEVHFFKNILHLIIMEGMDEENNESEAIYHLLQDNLLLLNEQLIEIISGQGEPVILESNSTQFEILSLEVITTACAVFAASISEFPLSCKATNLELAIASYHTALAGYPALHMLNKAYLSIQWATIQYNLANTYCERVQGDQQDNLQMAVEHYQLALTIFTHDLHPEDWAMTQCRLGDIYSNQLLGDKKDNLRRAQEYYQAALEVYTVDKHPEEWAEVQLDLARLNINKFRDYKAATELLRNTYKHLLTHKNSLELLAEVMFELAQCLHHIGQLEQAKLLLKDTVRLYQRLEQPTRIAAATGALGNLEMQMGKLTNARLHLQQSLDLYESLGRRKNVEAIQRLQKYLIMPTAGETLCL